MNITPNGDWSSETRQSNRLVRKMSGTYKQSSAGDASGTLVFTPMETSAGSGSGEVETDQYQIAGNGRELRLTSDGDTMVFKKQH